MQIYNVKLLQLKQCDYSEKLKHNCRKRKAISLSDKGALCGKCTNTSRGEVCTLPPPQPKDRRRLGSSMPQSLLEFCLFVANVSYLSKQSSCKECRGPHMPWFSGHWRMSELQLNLPCQNQPCPHSLTSSACRGQGHFGKAGHWNGQTFNLTLGNY